MAVPCCVVVRERVSFKTSDITCLYILRKYEMFGNSEGLIEDKLLYTKCCYPLKILASLLT